MKDLEVVTERLRSAEEAHGKEVDEQQRRSNDLQERLVETRAEKQQVGWLINGYARCCRLVVRGLRTAAAAAVAAVVVVEVPGDVVLCAVAAAVAASVVLIGVTGVAVMLFVFVAVVGGGCGVLFLLESSVS